MSQYMSFKPHNPNKLSKTRTPKSIAKESFSLSRVNQKIQPRPSSQNNKSELNQAVLSSVSALGNMSQYMSLKPHNPNKPRKTRTPKSIAKKSFSLPRVNQKIQPRPSSQNTKSELNQAVLSSVSDVGNMSQYMSFKLNNPNMPGKTRTPKSIAKKSFSLPRVNQKIQPRPSSQNNKSELNKAVLSSLSALRTKIDQSHILIQQIHKHIQSLSTENTVEKPAPPPAPPSVGMYFNYRIPLVSSLIRARTREVLTETPLTITEGPLSESNRPITDMVENYIQQLPEKKALMSVIVEQKTRRHLAYKLNRAKTSAELLEKRNQASRRRSRKIRVLADYRNIHLANKESLESKYGETVKDLLEKEMLSDIESDDGRESFTIFTPSNRHPLLKEYFNELKAWRTSDGKVHTIDIPSCAVESRHAELSKKQKARVKQWIATQQK